MSDPVSYHEFMREVHVEAELALIAFNAAKTGKAKRAALKHLREAQAACEARGAEWMTA